MSWSCAGDRIRIEIADRDYATLMLALGYATGAATDREETALAARFLQLANTLNEGNPDYLPYQTGKD
jgi:hypothetical protein